MIKTFTVKSLFCYFYCIFALYLCISGLIYPAVNKPLYVGYVSFFSIIVPMFAHLPLSGYAMKEGGLNLYMAFHMLISVVILMLGSILTLISANWIIYVFGLSFVIATASTYTISRIAYIEKLKSYN